MHLTSPEKNSHAHSDMPKSVHMHVKNFTYIASIMHVKFEIHMHDKIVSHAWKDFTCNKLHGKKVHTYDKNFSHVLQSFTRMSKSSHACEMLMWWTCIFANIDFTWFLFFTHFSHPFHMVFTHIALVVSFCFYNVSFLSFFIMKLEKLRVYLLYTIFLNIFHTDQSKTDRLINYC